MPATPCFDGKWGALKVDREEDRRTSAMTAPPTTFSPLRRGSLRRARAAMTGRSFRIMAAQAEPPRRGSPFVRSVEKTARQTGRREGQRVHGPLTLD